MCTMIENTGSDPLVTGFREGSSCGECRIWWIFLETARHTLDK